MVTLIIAVDDGMLTFYLSMVNAFFGERGWPIVMLQSYILESSGREQAFEGFELHVWNIDGMFNPRLPKGGGVRADPLPPRFFGNNF